jgi:hypothetical protein
MTALLDFLGWEQLTAVEQAAALGGAGRPLRPSATRPGRGWPAHLRAARASRRPARPAGLWFAGGSGGSVRSSPAG